MRFSRDGLSVKREAMGNSAMGTNYDKMAAYAAELFLKKDMDEMAALWGLETDPEYLYIPYFSQTVRLERSTAGLSLAKKAREDEYEPASWAYECMVLYDLLSYPFRDTGKPCRPSAAGEWASISSLGGIIGAGHDRTLGHDALAERFTGRVPELRRACERLHGTVTGKADAAYRIPVFADFDIVFQFWDADDEFPAQIRYLFDSNALQFMHYETLWYAMGRLNDRLDFYARL